MGEQALAALGLGGAAATATKLRERSRSRSRHHRGRSSSSSSSSSTRSRRRRGKPRGKEDIGQVIKAAVTAGAAEALRSRKQPGGWTGEKGRRVFTAAITAGGVDKFLASGSGDHGTRNILGSTAAGLLTNRFVNGSRSRSRSRSRGRGGRGRARSESRSGLKELAGAGLLTAGAKKLYDRVRSKSRGRRSSTSSSSSYDSRSPRRHNRDKKKRSSSISAYASKGLAALGLGEAADKINGKDKRHSHYDDDDGYYHRRSRDGAPPPYAGGGGYADPRDVGAPRSNAEHHHGGAVVHKGPNGLDLGPHRFGDPETDSDSDLGSSSDDERARKSAQKKTLITAGLASVATIHAAHSVYQSMEKRDTRHMAVMQGDITSEEARKQKIKVGIQDAAAIGIAALGIKGAMSEWKDMKEKRQEAAELKEKQERHKQKREARRAKLLTMGIDDRLGNSAPQLTSSSHGNGYVPPGGPTYFDGNPYHAGHSSPPPPVAPFPPYQQQQYQPPMPPPPGGPPPPRF